MSIFLTFLAILSVFIIILNLASWAALIKHRARNQFLNPSLYYNYGFNWLDMLSIVAVAYLLAFCFS